MLKERLSIIVQVVIRLVNEYCSDGIEKNIVIGLPNIEGIIDMIDGISILGSIKVYLFDCIGLCRDDLERGNNLIYITDPNLFTSKLNYLILDDIFTYNFNYSQLLKCGTKILGNFGDAFEGVVEVDNGVNVLTVEKDIKYHVYAIGLNDCKYLKHLFKYYHDCDKIIIVDNLSTDGTMNTTREYGKTLISYDTLGFYDLIKIKDIKNTIWKQSKNVDYVIIHNINEILFFGGDINAKLKEFKMRGTTIIKSSIRNIYCEDGVFETLDDDQYITSSLFECIDENEYDEVVCFSPSDIEDINYSIDTTNFDPKGNIKIENGGLVLKYKYTGVSDYIRKCETISKIISPKSKQLNIKSIYLDNNFSVNLEFKKDIFSEMYGDEIARVKVENKYCIVNTLGQSDLISKTILANKLWCSNMYDWFLKNITKDSIYIDVGSHIGIYIVYAKMLGANKIYGFEPSQKLFEKLQSTVNMNGWTNVMVSDISISKKSDEIEVINYKNVDVIYETKKLKNISREGVVVKKTSTLDHIIKPCILSLPFSIISPFFDSKYQPKSSSNISRSITPISDDSSDSLENSIFNLEKDLFIDIPQDNNNNFIIKISVEGHEYEVLQGMKKILSENNVKLIIDMDYTKIFIDKIGAILDFLENLNYNNATLINKIDGSDTEQIINNDIDYHGDFCLVDHGLGEYEYICPIGSNISFETITQLISQEYKLIISFNKSNT